MHEQSIISDRHVVDILGNNLTYYGSFYFYIENSAKNFPILFFVFPFFSSIALVCTDQHKNVSVWI